MTVYLDNLTDSLHIVEIFLKNKLQIETNERMLHKYKLDVSGKQ